MSLTKCSVTHSSARRGIGASKQERGKLSVYRLAAIVLSIILLTGMVALLYLGKGIMIR